MLKILSIIGPDRYQDVEYEDSKKALEAAGFEVVTGSIQFKVKGKYGGEAKVDLLLSDVEPLDYLGIVFIGGPGSHGLFDNKMAHKLAREFFESGKVTAAICAAPVILANAGLLDGVKCTCWEDQIGALSCKGCTVLPHEAVVVDGLIVTARDAKCATEFGEKVAETIKNL